jgi:rSAM/selenodomain-associated transferase 2
MIDDIESHRMPDLSVVVPTLNEAETIESCLDSIGASADVEVVVSDGGSGDATLVLAEARGARIVEGSAGRGGQLNRGAAAAGAGRLLFLHADCRLPSGWSTELSKALANPAVALACFYLRTEPAAGRDPSWVGGLWLRTLDLRSRGGRLPYGDQAFGVRREVFDAVGGFPDIPLMEDLVFARACSRVGRLVRIPREVRTTDRRTMRQPVRARVMHLVFPWLLRFGVSPATLARWYGNPR